MKWHDRLVLWAIAVAVLGLGLAVLDPDGLKFRNAKSRAIDVTVSVLETLKDHDSNLKEAQWQDVEKVRGNE